MEQMDKMPIRAGIVQNMLRMVAVRHPSRARKVNKVSLEECSLAFSLISRRHLVKAHGVRGERALVHK